MILKKGKEVLKGKLGFPTIFLGNSRGHAVPCDPLPIFEGM